MSQVTGDEEVLRRAEARLIASDICWSWRIGTDLTADNSGLAVPLLCVLPFVSLVVHETHKYLTRQEPSVAQSLRLQYGGVIERSRHRVKLFDDTKQGMQGVVDYFAEALVPAHKKRFVDQVRLPLAKYWKTDLGLFTYHGEQIGTTHVIHFNLGTSPEMMIRPSSQEFISLGEDMGKYIGRLAPNCQSQFPEFGWKASSFLKAIDTSELAQKDVRSDAYYKALFGGHLSLGALAAVDTMRCTLNTINTVMAADRTSVWDETLFKVRFVALYHVLRGLRQLARTEEPSLGSTGRELMAYIESQPTVAVLHTRASRQLRNALVHYGLGKQCPATALDMKKPLAGLVEFSHPGLDFAGLGASLRVLCEELGERLDEWGRQIGK